MVTKQLPGNAGEALSVTDDSSASASGEEFEDLAPDSAEDQTPLVADGDEAPVGQETNGASPREAAQKAPDVPPTPAPPPQPSVADYQRQQAVQQAEELSRQNIQLQEERVRLQNESAVNQMRLNQEQAGYLPEQIAQSITGLQDLQAEKGRLRQQARDNQASYVQAVKEVHAKQDVINALTAEYGVPRDKLERLGNPYEMKAFAADWRYENAVQAKTPVQEFKSDTPRSTVGSNLENIQEKMIQSGPTGLSDAEYKVFLDHVRR
jgi:hypothetical protein